MGNTQATPTSTPNEPRGATSLEETTLQRREYTQQHIDQNKVECCVCFDQFALRENLQQCPRCFQLFHTHCILENLMRARTTCPLCRNDLIDRHSSYWEQINMEEIAMNTSLVVAYSSIIVGFLVHYRS